MRFLTIQVKSRLFNLRIFRMHMSSWMKFTVIKKRRREKNERDQELQSVFVSDARNR